MRPDGKVTLAVTGGIGSGKSLVCSFFRQRGVPVYDSDSRTKALYEEIPGLLGRISRAVGTDVTDGNGRLDRKALAEAVFSSPSRLKMLEDMVYPEVRRDFEAWRRENFEAGERLVIMESALVLEKPFFRDLFDRILLVDAPVALRMERAMRRDSADEAAIARRMAGQKLLNCISDGKTVPDADFILVNDGDANELEKKTDEIYRKLINSSGQ